MMLCNDGLDSSGCPREGTCFPMEGPTGNDGTACPGFCPVECGPNGTWCDGGLDWNGCPMPATCQSPIKGFNGAECPANRPITCGANELWCDGGSDCNGCTMPATCVPNEDNLGKANFGI